MKLETTITDEKARDFLDPKGGAPMTRDRDAEITAEITRRMDRKAKGETSYRSLDEVMADHGFHAR